MQSPTPYMIFANEMGTEKTMTFFSAFKMRHILLERQLANLEKEPAFKAMEAKDKLKTERFGGFRPHLSISPPATLRQGVRRIGC
jgi:hypothetical protein